MDRDEAQANFIEANRSDLTTEFLATLPREDVPLDDDLSDFMDDNDDAFQQFCFEQYADFLNAGF